MEIYDIHFKNINEETVQLTFSSHEIDKRERTEDFIGTIMGEGLINAKFRFMQWVKEKFG